MKVIAYWVPIIRSILIAMGALWLPIEAYEGLSNTDATLPFYCFVILSIVVGIGFFALDGYHLTGFLKSHVNIKTDGFDTDVSIIFGDLFAQEGWKAIAVNDFFDNIVDNDLVSSRSLHGIAINKYWPDDRENWRKQVNSSLKNYPHEKENRSKGNQKRFSIGTTATAISDGQKLLFVALGETNVANNVTTASAESLICAVRGLLNKARTVCANEPLYIPLMGSGLGRVGIKNAVLVDLIITAIVEETKQSKVTSSITIVLPNDKKSKINLGNITRDWN